MEEPVATVDAANSGEPKTVFVPYFAGCGKTEDEVREEMERHYGPGVNVVLKPMGGLDDNARLVETITHDALLKMMDDVESEVPHVWWTAGMRCKL